LSERVKKKTIPCEVRFMKEFEKSPDSVKRQGAKDNPEQVPADKESLHDRFVSERSVDPIPLEDLRQEQQ
jgi:hypothetical protein